MCKHWPETPAERLRQVKQAARDKYAWPGGYPLFVIMEDGESLCTDCAKKEFRQIAHATITRDKGGWRAAGSDTNYEDAEMVCCHCGGKIESAYGPDTIPEHCPLFNVTYSTITPESAENGDYEKTGFISQGVRLREAWEDMGRDATEDSGRWISNNEYGHGTRDYYATGREEIRAIHPPENITESSYNRLLRLFGLKPRQ